MTATVLISIIGVAAVAFMVHFFIALCHEKHSGACHIVHIVRHQDGRQTEAAVLRPKGAVAVVGSAFRSRRCPEQSVIPGTAFIEEKHA